MTISGAKYNDLITVNMEIKILRVLQYYLSLHEADEIFDMIFDEDVSYLAIEKLLDYFKHQSEDQNS